MTDPILSQVPLVLIVDLRATLVISTERYLLSLILRSLSLVRSSKLYDTRKTSETSQGKTPVEIMLQSQTVTVTNKEILDS